MKSVLPKISDFYFGKKQEAGTGRIQLFLSVLISLVVLGFLAYYRAELINTLLHVDIAWILAGLLCYGINYILRAVRLYVLSGRRIVIWPNAIYASSLHGFVTYLMPFQVGDLSLPIILKAANKVGLPEGSAILIRTRLLDMISLGGLMLSASIGCDIDLGLSLRVLWFGIGVLLVIVPFLLRRLITSNWFQLNRFGRHLKPFLLVGRFSIIELFLSLGIWIAIAGVLFCVVRAIKLPIGFGGVWLLITIQLPLQLIPVQGLANTGNHEGAWIAALSLLGIPLMQAAEFAVTSHVIILFYVLVLGTVPLLTGSNN
jgi:uncharacterized membrane protein YbhN (UPF0104 family)